MGRAPCCEKVGMKKGRWTAEEDEILVNYIKAHGEGSWRSLPKNAGLLRCGKSCRLRWMNYLRADLKKGNISQEEEQIIINLHVSVGNRWSLIAGHLPGRSDNEIKNYWNSHLSRRIHTFRKPGDGNPVIVDLGEGAAACKRRGGRTKRSAMKKTLINISTRREKYENSNTVLPASLPQCGGDDGMFIDKNSDQITTVNLAGVDVVLGPIGDTCPLVFKGEGLVGPSQGVENGRWGVEEMEGPLLGGGEDSEVLSSIKDRESGVMSSGEGREGGALASNEDRDCGSSGLEEGIEEELLASGEEFGSLQMDSMVDWELERIKEASKLWVEDEEVRPWLWEYENGEPDFQGMETIAENQEDSLASWFLSDVW